MTCCACHAPLNRRDAYCKRRSCALFMAEADEIRQLTWRGRYSDHPLRYARLIAHLLVARRLEKQ
jgi:hypothetical protein